MIDTMKRDPETPPKVLIALMMSGKSGQDKLTGVFRYLQGRRHWDTSIIRTKDGLTPQMIDALPSRGVNGLILSVPPSDEVEDRIVHSSIPTVVLDILEAKRLRTRTHRIAFVVNDSSAIGARAAEYLLEQGVFQSFAYVGATRQYAWSQKRYEAFRRILAARGYGCQVFSEPVQDGIPDWDARRQALAEWLRGLPKPIGLLAAYDDRAHQILETCFDAGLKVPGDIAVLGVNNDEVICENTVPTLSSVQPDFEEEGYQAAALLDRLMAGSPDHPETVLCGVKQVVGRQSTVPTSQAGKLVQKAVAYIHANACKGIGVPDVARHLRVSRRLADLRFRQMQGQTILDAIRQERLERVKHLLTSDDSTIGEIGTRCGYENENYLKNLFKVRFGMTMRDYRKFSRL